MNPLNELQEKARKFNEDKKYKDVIELLTVTLLASYNNPELFAEKARAHLKLGETKLFFIIVDKMRSQKPELSDELYHESIDHYNSIVNAAPDKGSIYHSIGVAYQRLKQFETSIEYFDKVIKIKPTAIAYHGLGYGYKELNDVDNAILHFNKAVELDATLTEAYLSLGIIYKELDQYEKCIYNYSKAIEVNPNYDSSYYNRALAYNAREEYRKALADYEKYVELTKDSPDYFTTLAQSKIIELEKLIDNPDAININELINSIKKLLLFNDLTVTHYTSLSGAKALILDNSPFRISEGAYLNDTSEGRELFNYLSFHVKTKTYHDTIAEPFAIKPFIGSFVAENKHNDLTLWRMYGKEAKEEAKGCAITFRKDEFLDNLKKKLTSDRKNPLTVNSDEEFSFYRVAYYSNDQKDKFVIPGASEQDEETLNKYMEDLAFNIQHFNKNKPDMNGTQHVLKMLNEIAYLFKSAAYQYEHELRLVVNGIGIDKMILKDFTPPKVFIEMINIDSVLKKITLGPKVERADEWAAAFFYKLDKDGHHPEILISHLPFK